MFLERFRAEARHTAALVAHRHRRGLRLRRGAGTERRSPYIVMELVPGEPLSALHRAARARSRRTAPSTSSGRPRSALQAAHDAGVIHRDVKPGNILCRPRPDVVKVTDFGIARAADSVPLTRPARSWARRTTCRPSRLRARGHAGQRHLLPRRRGLRVPGRPPAVRRRHPGRRRAGAPAATSRRRCRDDMPARCATWSTRCWPRTRPRGRRSAGATLGRAGAAPLPKTAEAGHGRDRAADRHRSAARMSAVAAPRRAAARGADDAGHHAAPGRRGRGAGAELSGTDPGSGCRDRVHGDRGGSPYAARAGRRSPSCSCC